MKKTFILMVLVSTLSIPAFANLSHKCNWWYGKCLEKGAIINFINMNVREQHDNALTYTHNSCFIVDNVVDYFCQCGGKLEFSFMAYATWHECSLCHGKGYVTINHRRETCTLCYGKGRIPEWHSGYVCTRCGRVYKA